MSQQIGSVLARTFRELCKDSNTRAQKDFSMISDEEMKSVEKILKKMDNEKFDLRKELVKYFEVEDD